MLFRQQIWNPAEILESFLRSQKLINFLQLRLWHRNLTFQYSLVSLHVLLVPNCSLFDLPCKIINALQNLYEVNKQTSKQKTTIQIYTIPGYQSLKSLQLETSCLTVNWLIINLPFYTTVLGGADWCRQTSEGGLAISQSL